jgi:hypothetical protein
MGSCIVNVIQYSGRAISITYSECVFVALSIQHAMRMCYVFICGLSGSTLFFRLSHNRHFFGGGKMLFNLKRVWIFSTTFFRNISRSKKN